MSQCDLHVGDPTAHAIVEWVSAKLSSACNLTEVVSTLSEDFCKELDAERFINCLRQQVKKDRNLFEAIERIATELDDTKKWNYFPHLSVLLHNIAGESLKSQVSRSIVQEYRVFQKEYQELNPLRLELLIRARSTEGWKFANRLNQNLKSDKTKKKEIVKALAKDFRILQWDLLVRNLIEENMKGELRFHPITVNYEMPGTPDLKEFLIPFIAEARSVEGRFILSDGGIPAKLHADYLLEKSFRQCYISFHTLLPRVRELYPPVHENYVRAFANMRASGDFSSNVLVEDGEISFFSLLWLLRYAVSKGKQPKDWKSDPDEKLTIRFRPSNDKSPDDWWSSCNMYELAEECGLIISLSESECIPTRRWHSLITWLGRLNLNLRDKFEDDKQHLQSIKLHKKLDHDNPLLQRLPVKRLDYDKEAELSFVDKLREFLASDELPDMLDDLSVHVSMTCEVFVVEKLGRLFESLGSLLEVESVATEEAATEAKSSAGLEDTVLLRCCWGFIPLEHLFRTYQPYELHLLIQTLNWEESSLKGWGLAPISLAFANIAGQVKTPNSEKSQDASVDFDRWLVPYRSLFSALGADIALPIVQDRGSLEQKTYFAHQTAGLLDTVWLDPKRDELDFRSKFALWLAIIHTTEIWGSFPVDTEKRIYDEDFPELGESNAKEIVDKLVDLGLRGGILRAGRPPKDGREDNPEWDLTVYVETELLGSPEQIISHVYEQLSCQVPEDTAPPEWITAKAFAACFYHGLRQAVYHALKTFVLTDGKRKGQPCLWIKWDEQSVSIYNRGEVAAEQSHGNFASTDRAFFDLFLQKTEEFCRQHGIAKKFRIDGPEPAATSDTWQLVIRKE